MAKYYEEYLNVVLDKWTKELQKANNQINSNEFVLELYKGTLKDFNYELYQAELSKLKPKIIESNNNIASFYANTDKAKAIEWLNKTLALDPTNAYALEAMKMLK